MVDLTWFVGGKTVRKVFQNRSDDGNRSGTDNSFDSVLLPCLRKAILTTLLFSPLLAQALGLGSLTTDSSLNEPFDARIQLLNSNSQELETLSVTLAGAEQFKNAGVERPFLLSSLKFAVVEDPAGNYLHITSEESIKEPFLNFLLEVDWAKGRLIREYTALLDPPVFDDNSRIVDQTETAVSEPEIAVPAQVPQQNIKIEQLPDATLVNDADVESGLVVPADEMVSPSEPVFVEDEPVVYEETIRSRPQSFSSDNSTYTTSRGDTLWSIASQSRPSRSVSIQQMMVSLLNTNPGAFYEPNINFLKSGQVLKIPDQDTTRQLTKSEAIALVKEHNALWDDYRQGLASTATPRPVGAVSSGAILDELIEEETIVEPELRLVSATGDTTTGEEVTTGAGLSDTTLENDLALANEQLESGKSENAELTDRLRESEEIVELLKQQVELKNHELATLQKKLREADRIESLKGAESPSLASEDSPVVKIPEDEIEVKTEEESIDDILSQLEEEEEETSYLEYDEELASDIPSVNYEYDVPAENLTGQETDTQFIAEEAAGWSSERPAGQENIIDSSAPDEMVNEEESLVDEIEIDDEPMTKQGMLGKVKGMLPAGLIDSVPGGIKSILGIALVLLALLLVGLFKLFGRGTTKEDAETLDLLDPGEFDEAEEITEEFIPEEIEQGLTEESLENIMSDIDNESEMEVTEEFDIDFEEEPLPDHSDSESPDDQLSSLDDIDDELGDVDLVSLEDTLEQIQPLIEQPEDDLLEEASLSALDEEKIDDLASLEATMTQVEPSLEQANEDLPEEISLPTMEMDEDELDAEGLVNLEDTLEQIKPLLEQTEEELEEDPLEEVNLSLAYEQFDKAEAIVNKAIDEHPEENGYKLRLLEVHYAANNKEAYETAAKPLYETTNGEGHLWDSAVAMWSEMSPERELFSDAEDTGDQMATSSDLLSSEQDSVLDIDIGSTDPIPEMTLVEDDTLEEEGDEDEVFNLGDESAGLDTAELIDISAETNEDASSEDDFLNIADVEIDNALLTDTVPDLEDDLTLELEASLELEETKPSDPLSIDMLDITAVGSNEDITDASEDTDSSAAEELFELTNEFKSVDENILSATSLEPEESAEILEFSSDDLAVNDDIQDLTSDEEDDFAATAEDLELESLAKSLEDTISGLDSSDLEDLTFEFDPEGTLENTLASSLDSSLDIDLENESDEIDTKLNLAKAYIELGDADGAKSILHEVNVDGNDEQKKDAQALLQQIS